MGSTSKNPSRADALPVIQCKRCLLDSIISFEPDPDD